jgi:hypothetical protein
MKPTDTGSLSILSGTYEESECKSGDTILVSFPSDFPSADRGRRPRVARLAGHSALCRYVGAARAARAVFAKASARRGVRIANGKWRMANGPHPGPLPEGEGEWGGVLFGRRILARCFNPGPGACGGRL